jgi:SAM-dependent methyltransferase
MNLYERFLLPTLVTGACSCSPIDKQRQKIVPDAEGVVLELGFGAGLNLPHYDASKVRKLYALEPSPGMVKRARGAVTRSPIDVEILAETAESLSLDPNSVDTVLVTYSLCTIPDAVTALEVARRALKPSGRLLFCEHGLSPDQGVQRWQQRIEPVWKVIGGGCHLSRDIPALIKAAGFSIDTLETMYLPKSPKWAAYNYWGAARVA